MDTIRPKKLEQLRLLRTRADRLIANAKDDLGAYVHRHDKVTFVRTPVSLVQLGDVNVSTTCSCVMALAQLGFFYEFYRSRNEQVLSKNDASRTLLKALMDAPWMSSGLAQNNPFTATMVLRTFGMLKKQGLIDGEFDSAKPWLSHTNIDTKKLATELKKGITSPAHDFLRKSLSDKAKAVLSSGSDSIEVERVLEDGLREIVHGSWVYEPSRFPNQQVPDISAGELNSNLRAEINSRVIREFIGTRSGDLPENMTLTNIAKFLCAEPENLRVNNYPSSPAVMYWCIDGVSNAGIELSSESLQKLRDWSVNQFNHQRSLVSARKHATMDPVSLGMAACLCARFRAIERDHGDLPSNEELVHAIREIFGFQHDDGIWPKYFPMFHYQGAGSNFCFTFELLEAILHEFGNSRFLFEDDALLLGLDRAVTWCEQSKLRYGKDGVDYFGWNSGGDLETLKKGMPESWATAVVYMFLAELSRCLSEEIQHHVIEKYGSEAPNKNLAAMMDVPVNVDGKVDESLKKLVARELIGPNTGRNAVEIRREKLRGATSALLFGPPGTSKTQLAKAIAAELRWRIVVINPSTFVRRGVERVFEQSEEIFDDIGDLSGVVVFFDEMDALGQSREKERLDTTTQFLTTSMLPKLVKLHDEKRIVFVMATNYQDKFDPAIKRSGRFDLLLCVGPPSLDEKLSKIAMFVETGKLSSEDAEKCAILIRNFIQNDPEIRLQLGLFTFGDFRSFVHSLTADGRLLDVLSNIDSERFGEIVRQFGRRVTLRLAELHAFADQHAGVSIWDGVKASLVRGEYPQIPWSKLDESERERLERVEICRFLKDREESRVQVT